MITAVGRYREVERWDVKYLLQPDWNWPARKLRRIGDVLTRKQDEVDKEQEPDLKLGSIHFDGSLSDRGKTVSDLKGKTFRATANDIVFSKIDIRNGAIAVVGDKFGDVGFTSEFPVYSVKDGVDLSPDFLRLVLRTPVFRARINAQVVGHSGRRRLSPDLFEATEIPFPDLDEQRQLVSRSRELRQAAEELEERAQNRIEGARSDVLRQLGIEVNRYVPPTKPFVVGSGALDRWSVEFAAFAAQGLTDDPEFGFPAVRVEDVADVAYGLTKSPDNRPDQHPHPYLRVANVQAGYLDLEEIKYIDVPDDQLESYLLNPLDLLLCEGNSIDLVGRPALWHGEIEGCVHQNHVLRVRVTDSRLRPEFLFRYMETQQARLYFRSRAKQTTNLATINSTDVKEMMAPLPPKDVQDDVVQLMAEAEAEAGALREQAQKRHEERLGVIEGFIDRG